MRIRILALIVAALLLSPSASEARRVALVVGNGTYATVPALPNPPADAEAVAAALRGGGFQVMLARDVGRAALEAALRAFAREAVGAEVAVFFFAGHGLQIGGENHVVPTDARLAAPSDVDFELVPLDLVARALSGAQARILILDACRDNPMAARLPAGSRSVGRGLAPVERVDLGMLIAFSTAPGAVALDGTGGNSPFTEALVEHLRTPGLEIRQVMTRVRRSVVERTGGRQVPWDNSSLLADIVLTPAVAPVVPPPPSSGAAAAPMTATPPARPPVEAPPAATAHAAQAPAPPRPDLGRAASPDSPAAPPSPEQRVAALPLPPPPMPLPPPPVALPRPAPPEGASAPSGRITAAAAARGIPLPAELPRPPAGASGLSGVFATPAGRNPLGRQVLVVLAPAAGGAVDVLFGAGPGWQLGFSEGLAAFSTRRSLTPGWGGTLSFTDESGDAYQVSLGWGGEVVVTITRPTLIGWREGVGRAAREVSSPTARATLQRIE